MPVSPDWTDDELILALDLFFRVNPRSVSKNDPAIISVSEVLNCLPLHPKSVRTEKFRNPNGVRMKLANFLRFDLSYQGKAMERGSHREERIWKLYANDRQKLSRVAAAIRDAGNRQVRDSATQLPDPDEDESFAEGMILSREHRYRERNRSLVQKKKKAVLRSRGNLACEVCGFDFHKVYGGLGKDFAECHHTVPISELGERAQTRIADLAIVCANCHRMLHRGPSWKTIHKLRELLSTAYS
jgi:5-methylcytosine-specific restriction enzyme A